MSFFGVGEVYRNHYRVEHVVTFFDGELAVARKGQSRYYLQSASLQKQAPSRAIQQYRTLTHPLVPAFEEVYTEDRSIVFIRPYEPIHPLREVISTREVDEDQVVAWGRQLLELEAELKSKPMPMYLLLDPRNIGLSDQDELRVLFCGLEQITAQSRTLDWGSFFFCLLSGQYLDAPLEKLPPNFPCSKPMSRLIQRSLRNESVESVLSQLETYERRKNPSKGIFGFFFNSEKTEPKIQADKVDEPHVSDVQEEKSADKELEQKREQVEEELIERLRREFEERQEEMLRKQREELERKQQELLEKQRLEFEQKERQLLAQQKEEFIRRMEQEDEPENSEPEQKRDERPNETEAEQGHAEEERKHEEEEEARIEEEKQARAEQMKREQEDRVQAELERLKLERLEWEKKRLELERKEEEMKTRLQQEFEELAKKLLAKQEEEFKRYQQKMLEQEREFLENKTRERLERQRLELEQTSKHYLLTRQHTKPRASLFDLPPQDFKPVREPEPPAPAEETKEEQATEAPPAKEEKQEREKQTGEAKERWKQEKLEHESQEHDQLAKQFEEYMKQMLGDES